MMMIRRFYENVCRWFSCWKVISKIWDDNYNSILTIEKYQIKRIRNNVLNGYHYDEYDVQCMNTILRLIDIIEENGCAKFLGKFKFKLIGENTYGIDSKGYYTIPVYVNTRNYKRFMTCNPKRFQDFKYGNLWKDQLRLKKAWYLYHELRKQYLKNWW